MKKYITLSQRTFVIFVLAFVTAVLLAINFAHQVAAKENRDSSNYEELKIFTDVLALVKKNYVQEVELKTLVEGAVKGMLLTLDPHSSYLSPDLYKDLQVETKGEFGGLGIEITVKDNQLTVVAPIEDSPAYKVGVQAGDQIIKIGEEFTKDLSLVEAVKKMRGPKGSPITIYVHRENRTGLIPFTIIRDVIHVKSVRSRILEDGFGYLRLAQFQDGSAEELITSLKELNKKSKDGKLSGLVLDLRNNPGGLLTQAIRVADLFLKDGMIVYTEGRQEGNKQEHVAENDGNEPDYPLIVMVNGGSASASEIVAGAFQDHKRALVLGTQTFGKGSVQTILPMENGAALRLTTALYYTKSGRSIQAEGVTPDVAILDRKFPSDAEELLEEDEKVPMSERELPRAIQNPKAKENSKKKETSKKDEDAERLRIGSRQAMDAALTDLLRDDPQLEEALRLLKTWHVFQVKPGTAEKPADQAALK